MNSNHEKSSQKKIIKQEKENWEMRSLNIMKWKGRIKYKSMKSIFGLTSQNSGSCKKLSGIHTLGSI